MTRCLLADKSTTGFLLIHKRFLAISSSYRLTIKYVSNNDDIDAFCSF